MSTFSWILLFLFAVFSYFGGKLLSHYYGLPGWILGVLAGSSLFVLAHLLVMYYINKWLPIHPICKNGVCTSDDYRIVKYNEGDGTCIFRCECGTRYFQNLPYFKEMLSDGSLKAYMKRTRWHRWETDEADV